MVAFLEIDLDPGLQFSKGFIGLSNQGLIAYKNQNELPPTDPLAWERWSFTADLNLQLHDHAGVASLELINNTGRLAQ